LDKKEKENNIKNDGKQMGGQRDKARKEGGEK
jgi:hypothetical protein